QLPIAEVGNSRLPVSGKRNRQLFWGMTGFAGEVIRFSEPGRYPPLRRFGEGRVAGEPARDLVPSPARLRIAQEQPFQKLPQVDCGSRSSKPFRSLGRLTSRTAVS